MNRERARLVLIGYPGWLQPPKMNEGPLFTEEVLERALTYLRDGVTLNRACTMDPTLPSSSTLRKWLVEHRREEYEAARKIGADAKEERIEDAVMGHEVDGMIVEVDRARLYVEWAKMFLPTMNREKYGRQDTLTINHNISLQAALDEADRRLADQRMKVIEHEG